MYHIYMKWARKTLDWLPFVDVPIVSVQNKKGKSARRKRFLGGYAGSNAGRALDAVFIGYT